MSQKQIKKIRKVFTELGFNPMQIKKLSKEFCAKNALDKTSTMKILDELIQQKREIDLAGNGQTTRIK